MRSLLFVPADSPAKLAKALGAGADALILDLEDSVAPASKPAARTSAAAFLDEHRAAAVRPRFYVRVNALDTPYAMDDIAAIVPHGPDGLVLPKARGGEDVHRASIAIGHAEQTAGLKDHATSLVVLATEVAVALLNMSTFPGSSSRLEALTWGAEDLSSALGARANRDETGAFTSPYRLARDLCLITASAAGVPAIDTVYPAYKDLDGLRRECEAASRDGFDGKLAIHPAQVPVINEAFTPGAAELARARAIVEAFAQAGDGVGVVGLGGDMLDRPHLVRAERVLERGKLAGAGAP